MSEFSGSDPAERAKLELARDEQLRQTQDEDKRYQIAKIVPYMELWSAYATQTHMTSEWQASSSQDYSTYLFL